MTGPGPDGYDPEDFGADGIKKRENWRDSGYDHYTAWSDKGSHISWNTCPVMASTVLMCTFRLLRKIQVEDSDTVADNIDKSL